MIKICYIKKQKKSSLSISKMQDFKVKKICKCVCKEFRKKVWEKIQIADHLK